MAPWRSCSPLTPTLAASGTGTPSLRGSERAADAHPLPLGTAGPGLGCGQTLRFQECEGRHGRETRGHARSHVPDATEFRWENAAARAASSSLPGRRCRPEESVLAGTRARLIPYVPAAAIAVGNGEYQIGSPDPRPWCGGSGRPRREPCARRCRLPSRLTATTDLDAFRRHHLSRVEDVASRDGGKWLKCGRIGASWPDRSPQMNPSGDPSVFAVPHQPL